jgi:hypothetical protein
MNERIRELAEQAAHDTRAIHNNAYWRLLDDLVEDVTWREKFAELIIQKCVDICIEQETSDFVKHTETHNIQFAAGYETGCDHCEVMIKDYFGVE